MLKQKIVVAMSGGVDSSTVAALLKSEGHEVIGVTLQLYDYGIVAERKGACCAGQDIYDAQVAAETIGIPHYVLNYESVFKQEVMEDFADSYLRGETPIPCVRCNQRVKFRDLFRMAKDLGADALATGHYVQKRTLLDRPSWLLKGADPKKDQSYFLFTTTQEQLDYLMFPLGHMNKNQTRQMAQRFGLKIFDKPDSQDICFVPNGSYAQIVEKLRPGALDPGDIVDKEGNIIGRHDGIINYTIGQRRGIGLAHHSPLYVLALNADRKQVIVGQYEDLACSTVQLQQVNWLALEMPQEVECQIKLRSAHDGCSATLKLQPNNRAIVTLHQPYFGVTPGQACVAYTDDRLLGGGWITSLNTNHHGQH